MTATVCMAIAYFPHDVSDSESGRHTRAEKYILNTVHEERWELGNRGGVQVAYLKSLVCTHWATLLLLVFLGRLGLATFTSVLALLSGEDVVDAQQHARRFDRRLEHLERSKRGREGEREETSKVQWDSSALEEWASALAGDVDRSLLTCVLTAKGS